MPATRTQPQRDGAVLMLYESYASAEVAVEALSRAGLAMGHVSGVGRDSDLELATAPGARFTSNGWRRLGPRLNGRGGLLIPGVGRLVVMGPLVHRLATALAEGVAGGAAGLLREVLIGIGVADGSVVRCALAVRKGGVLILVHAPAESLEDASTALKAPDAVPLAMRLAHG